jgi:hypothetical protein
MRRTEGSGVATGVRAMVYSTSVLLFTGSVTVPVNVSTPARYGTVHVAQVFVPSPILSYDQKLKSTIWLLESVLMNAAPRLARVKVIGPLLGKLENVRENASIKLVGALVKTELLGVSTALSIVTWPTPNEGPPATSV